MIQRQLFIDAKFAPMMVPQCPQCRSTDLRPETAGIQRLEFTRAEAVCGVVESEPTGRRNRSSTSSHALVREATGTIECRDRPGNQTIPLATPILGQPQQRFVVDRFANVTRFTDVTKLADVAGLPM